jgi:ribosomal protein S18 acetylase RimI-like enzyme
MVDIRAATEESASVRKATPDDAPKMAGALARAFFDDPVFTWVLHEDPRRLVILRRAFELFLRRVWLEHEETFTTPSVAGVAVWEPPGHWKHGLGEQLRLLPAMLAAFGRRLPRVLRALAALESEHPAEPVAQAHFYLPFIGVDPQWQGHGLGGALLAPILERCDRERTPAFLEASTLRSKALYERNGFTVMEEFALGKGAPVQWRMWRLPGTVPRVSTNHEA